MTQTRAQRLRGVENCLVFIDDDTPATSISRVGDRVYECRANTPLAGVDIVKENIGARITDLIASKEMPGADRRAIDAKIHQLQQAYRHVDEAGGGMYNTIGHLTDWLGRVGLYDLVNYEGDESGAATISAMLEYTSKNDGMLSDALKGTDEFGPGNDAKAAVAYTIGNLELAHSHASAAGESGI